MRKEDKKRLIDRAKEKPANKVRKGFSIDPDVYRRFMEECRKEKAKASNLIENFMRDFIGGEK